MPGLLTIAQTCARLEVSEKTFRGMIRTGEFPPFVRRGKRFVRVKEQDVNDYLQKLLERRAV